jgi:aspartate dehydrogenase
MKVGIIGMGTIGQRVATGLDSGEVSGVQLGALSSRNLGRAMEFAKSLETPPPVVTMEEVPPLVDLVIEAAGQDAVDPIAQSTLRCGKDLMVLSCGALLEREDLLTLAAQNGASIYAPSGAIACLDGIMGAAMGHIDSLTMISTKPPEGFKDTPGMVGSPIDLDSLTEPATLFEGSAVEACRLFPANINVSAAVAMAGLGPHETKIRIVADPSVVHNTHEIVVTGEFGILQMKIQNIPSVSNTKTGILTALSTLASLRKLVSPLKVGT